VIDTTAERVGTIDIARGPGIGVDAVRVDPTGPACTWRRRTPAVAGSTW
jgi:hypothetical protein